MEEPGRTKEDPPEPKGAGEQTPSREPRLRGSTKLWAMLGALGILGAVGTTVFQAVVEAGKDVVFKPLRVTMVDTRGAPQFLFPRAVDPRDAPLGTVHSDETARFIEWANDVGGVSYGCQGFRLVIEGRDASPVTITKVEIGVLTHESSKGHWVSTFEYGAGLPVREFKADLRDPVPRLQVYREGRPVRFGALKVSNSEPEVFDVAIQAGRGTFAWILRIGYSTEGESDTLEVSDNGKPCVLAGGGNPLRYETTIDRSVRPPKYVFTEAGRMRHLGDRPRRVCS